VDERKYWKSKIGVTKGMSGYHNYENLVVWQKSMDLVQCVYKLTDSFPSQEQFGLTLQMRRCSISLPSNIAEGSRRGTDKEFVRFLLIAFGSGAELETQLKITRRLGSAPHQEILEVENILEEVMKMLNILTKKLTR